MKTDEGAFGRVGKRVPGPGCGMSSEARSGAIVGIVLVMLCGGARGAVAQEPFPIDTVRVEVGSRVSAAMPVQTRGVEVITREALARLPARTVAEALETALGVDVMSRSPAQADLAIRGSSFEQVLVLVDGVRMSDPQSGHFDMNLALPLEQVERIEVLRGPASALYGSDAVGGVVNVVTRRGSASTVSGRAETGSFGTTVFAGAAALAGAAGWLDVGLEQQRSDGHRDGTDYRLSQLRFAGGFPTGGRSVRAELGLAQRDFGAAEFYAAFPSYEETRTTVATLSWHAAPQARSGIDARASFRRHGDEFILFRDRPAVYRNVHTSQQWGGEVTARTEAGRGLRLAGGVEAYRDELESVGHRNGNSAAALGERSAWRNAAFGEAALLRGPLALNAGLRADRHEEHGDFLAPSAAAAWWASPTLKLRTSLGRAFRAPTWTERFYSDPGNVGSPDLEPERSWSADLGLDYTPAPGVTLGLTGWHRRAEHLIDWARPTGSSEPWRTRNVGDATFDGLEAAAAAPLLGTRWTAQAALVRFSSTAEPGYTSKYALRPVDRSFSLAALHSLPFGLEASGRVRHSRRAGEAEPNPLLACTVGAPASRSELDARLTYRLDRARLHLDVRNAADAAACDIIAQPTPGRGFFLGVQWGL
jgi:vitamin B12 transporter